MPHQQKKPSKLHHVPPNPFNFVGTYLFDLNGKNVILLADSYSKYIAFQDLSAPNSEHKIYFL